MMPSVESTTTAQAIVAAWWRRVPDVHGTRAQLVDAIAQALDAAKGKK